MKEPVNGAAVDTVAIVQESNLAESPVPMPVKAGQVVDFTPKCAAALDPAPSYQLQIPSIAARAAYQRDQIARCGGEYPDDGLIRWAFRRAVKQTFEDGDQVIAEIAELEAALKDNVSQESVDEATLRLRELELLVSRRDPRYAEIAAARRYHLAMMPTIVLQHFLVGWKNVDGEFKRVNRLTAESSLDQIPDDQRREVASRAMQLMSTTSATAKN